MNFKFTLSKFVYIILNVMYISSTARGSGKRSSKFLASNVKANSNYVINATTKIIDGKFNLEYTLVKPLKIGYMSKMEFQKYLREDKRYQTLLTHDYDTCKVMSGLERASLINAWYLDMIKHSNQVKTCPMPVGHYFVHNLTMTSASIPVYLLTGDYRITFQNYFGKRKTKSEIFIVSVSMDLQIL